MKEHQERVRDAELGLKIALGGKCEVCKEGPPKLMEFHGENRIKEYFSNGEQKKVSQTTWFRRWMIAYEKWKKGEISEEESKKHVPEGIHPIHPHLCHSKAEKLFP